MGLTCMAANCAGSYFCCGDDQFQGNIIFKSINFNLINEDDKLSEEERKTLENCENILKQMEQDRLKIAHKFEELLDNTGAGVLFQPTLERAIISFIIYLLEQIILCAKRKNAVFDREDFSLTNFISIKLDSPPFININDETLNNFKAKYGFDINMVETIGKAQKSIISFLSTIVETKSVIGKQYDMFKELLTDYTNIRLFEKIKDAIEGIKFIYNYYTEITSSFFLAQSELSNPRKIELYFKIAQNAAEKEIEDPKELVIRYSWGENCGDIKKWKENIVYKKVEVLKY